MCPGWRRPAEAGRVFTLPDLCLVAASSFLSLLFSASSSRSRFGIGYIHAAAPRLTYQRLQAPVDHAHRK